MPGAAYSTDRHDERSAYAILGVSHDASPEAIREAYQRLVQQYHPDRMVGLAPELQALALQRMKDINAAYGTLYRSRGK